MKLVQLSSRSLLSFNFLSFFGYVEGLCHSGTDQRDYLYFIAEGYYKLNVSQIIKQFVKFSNTN